MIDLGKVNAAFDVITKLLHKGSAYEGDARHKTLWHRENFARFLKHQDHLVRPVTTEFWLSPGCTARCSLYPCHQSKVRKMAARRSLRWSRLSREAERLV